MVRVTSHKRWYHGSSKLGAQTILAEGIIRPGMPTKYRQDIPREDAVYVTSDKEIAMGYMEKGGTVFEVEVDESKLIPDEDIVFAMLEESLRPKTKLLEDRVLSDWAKYSFGVYGDRKPLTKKQAMQRFVFLAEKNMEDPFTIELAEEMKDFVEWIAEKNPKLAKDLITYGETAAHLGPVRVVREAK